MAHVASTAPFCFVARLPAGRLAFAAPAARGGAVPARPHGERVAASVDERGRPAHAHGPVRTRARGRARTHRRAGHAAAAGCARSHAPGGEERAPPCSRAGAPDARGGSRPNALPTGGGAHRLAAPAGAAHARSEAASLPDALGGVCQRDRLSAGEPARREHDPAPRDHRAESGAGERGSDPLPLSQRRARPERGRQRATRGRAQPGQARDAAARG